MDAPGDYYSSAVAADGRLYVASQRGTVVVMDAGESYFHPRASGEDRLAVLSAVNRAAK